jgi:hypothetical protein
LGGDFNARTATLLNTIDTSDLCELFISTWARWN